MNIGDTNNLSMLGNGKAAVLNKNRYVKIHVCQASYGDCLAIEFDDEASVPGSSGLIPVEIDPHQNEIEEEKTDGDIEIETTKIEKTDQNQTHQTYKLIPDLNTSKQRQKDESRKVFLIDGGPANYQILGTVLNPTTPLANMYAMLNTLLPEGCPNALDTLVITHDDADHINGLHQMMLSMAGKSGSGNPEFRFNRGVEALESQRSPFANIWYNSPTLLFKDKEAKGWFDLDIDRLKVSWPNAARAIAKCNSDFENLVVGNAGVENAMSEGKAKRSHLNFQFLSPNVQQINKLKKQYMEGKKKKKEIGEENKGKKTNRTVKKESKLEKKGMAKKEKAAERSQGVEYNGLPNAAGSKAIYGNDTVAQKLKMSPEIWQRIGEGVKGNLNDTSAKNQSSLVFVVTDNAATFSAAFTGDGNATDSFLPLWTGEPLRYDVLKIMHHGSQHNNCWKPTAVSKRIADLKRKNGFKPAEAFVNGKMKAEKPASMEIEEQENTNWDKIPQICKTNGQDKPTTFFLNVLAKKYIISSSTTEGHLNPHLSTLAGIMTRAIVLKEDKGIDIYLTTQTLQAQIQGFLKTYGRPNSVMVIDEETTMTETVINAVTLAPPGPGKGRQLFWDADGSYYRIWQLRAEIYPKFGTIMLDPAEESSFCNPAWQRVSLTREFWVAYHQAHFTTGVQLTIGAKPTRHYDDLKRPNPFDTGPGKGQKMDTAGNRERLPSEGACKSAPKRTPKTPRKVAPMANAKKSTEDAVLNTEPEMKIENILDRLGGPNSNLMSTTTDLSATMEQATDQTDVHIRNVWRQAIGTEGSLSLTAFARFDIRISQLIYEAHSLLQSFETKLFSDPDAFVNYLALRGWLLPDQIAALETNHIRNGQITLGGITSLVFDEFLSTSFFSLLPISLEKKALFSTTPFFWPLSDIFQATILIHPERRNLANDFSEVRSMTFSVKPPVAYRKWDMPYRLAGGKMAFWQIKVLSELKFLIYRPFERDCRYVYGCFLGKLSNGQGSNVVVDFVWFPDKDSGLDYHVRFADSNFVTDGYVITVGDLWSAIPTSFSSVSTLAASLLFPGKDTPIAIGEFMNIHNCGFVVQKNSPIVSDVTLKRIFGTVSFDQNQEFKPFGDIITIRLPTVRLQIENLFSLVPLKIFVRIEERLDIYNFQVPIVFETRRSRGGDQTIYQLSYVSSSPETSLTPAQLLKWLGIASSKFSDIPGLRKLMSSLHILSFSLGWFGGSAGGSRATSFSAKPDFVELSIQLDQLNLVPNLLAVENTFLDLRLDRTSSSYKVSLTAHAKFAIGGCSVQFLIAYGDRREWQSVYAHDDIPGHFKLALRTGFSGALSLSNILGHFMPNVQCIPQALQTILTRTGITKFRLGVDKNDDGKNEIAMLDLEVMLEEEDMEILEGMSISNPRFKLRVDYPGDRDSRVINASISVYTQIEDERIQATIWLDTHEDTIIGMSIIPVNESFALGKVIEFFAKKLSETFTLNIPQDFSFMKGIDVGPMNVSFRKTAGTKYKVDSLFVEVEVNRDFELWDSPRVTLSDVKLLANYIRRSGVHIVFGVSLLVGSYHFCGSLSYDRPSSGTNLADEAQEGDDESPVVLGKDRTSYTAHLSFKGELSLHDIISKLTGANLTEMLQQTQLDNLSKYTNIKIHSIDLQLSKAPSLWKISLSADIEWLGFTRVSLTGSHSISWAFNLKLECNGGPLKVLPNSWATQIGKYVKFDDTSIYLFYGPIDAGPQKKLILNEKSRAMLGAKGGIAVSTTLKFGSNLRILEEWLKIDSLKVFGAAGVGFFILGVQVGKLALFENAFSIKGDFLFSYIDKQLWIGLEGSFKFDIPDISKTPITGSVSAGVDLANRGLAFKFNTDSKLEDLGGIKGFCLDAVAIELVLAPEAGLMPTLLGVEGGVNIEDLDNVSGHLGVKFVANNPYNCYLEGRLENLNLMSLLNKFATAIHLPLEVQSFLENNGINLQFLAIQLIPKDMIGMTNQELKRRIYFEGSLSLVVSGDSVWAGCILLDIEDSSFTAIALMDPIQLVHEEAFSLKRIPEGSNTTLYNLDSLQLPQMRPSYLTERMLSQGPVLKITSQVPDPVFISAQLKFLGTKHSLFAAVIDDGFTNNFDIERNFGTIKFSVNCVFKSSIDIVASADLDLGQRILALVTTLSQLDGVPETNDIKSQARRNTSVRFCGTLKVGVAWATGKDPLGITLSGSVHVFNQRWDISEIGMKITESDLRSLETFVHQLWESIKSNFTKLVIGWIRDIKTEVLTAVQFLQANFDIASDKLVRLIADIKRVAVTKSIISVINGLNMVYPNALGLCYKFGFAGFMGGKLLSPMYFGPGPATIGYSNSQEHTVNFHTPAAPAPPPALALGPTVTVDDPFKKLPNSISVPPAFLFETDFTSLVDEQPEEKDLTPPPDVVAQLKMPHDALVARLPTWFNDEDEQYVTSLMTEVPANAVDETVSRIATFTENEVIYVAKSLKIAGLSHDDIQKAYEDSFGHDMPPRLRKQV